MEPSAQKITELREIFFKKLNDEGPPDSKGFHPADIARIKENDSWLKRFLEHNDLNVQESLNMLWKVCTWRQQSSINEISSNNIKKEYLEEGSLFGYGKDKNDKTLFVLRSKYHSKGKNTPELQRCVMYWFERLERENNYGDQISLFFDMTESGLSNVDMEFTQFLIGLTKNYYPYFLNYIIIFEMPWVLNAAFKIIKSWLPAKTVPRIKFLNKSTLHEYVDPNHALKIWGGNNDYTFKFVPETQVSHENSVNGKSENKKVHFAEGSPTAEELSGGIGDYENDETLLSVEPKRIIFNKEGNETIAKIYLKNLSTDKPISFKIKTTAPKLFRVKPTMGMLTPSEQCNVVITLQAGHNVHDVTEFDRFLVMCLPLNSFDANQDLTALWKSQMPKEQQKLQCVGDANETQQLNSILSSGYSTSDRTINTFISKMTCLEENCNKLHNELKTLKCLVLLSIMLTILIAIALAYVLKKDIRDYNDKQHCPAYHDFDGQ